MNETVKNILWLLYSVVFTIIDFMLSFYCVGMIMVYLNNGWEDYSLLYNIVTVIMIIYLSFQKFLNIAIHDVPDPISVYDVKVTVKPTKTPEN